MMNIFSIKHETSVHQSSYYQAITLTYSLSENIR